MRGGLARTALRPASLGLLALLLAAASAFAWLGHWQLDRSREHARTSPTEVVVPLGRVLAPASPFTGHADDQRVSAAGTWLPLAPQVVPRGGGASWVVAALRVDATGGTLPVVLGRLGAGAPAPAAPTGTADLVGRLQLSEEPVGVTGGRVAAVSSADLVNLWPTPLYTGYLVADAGPATTGTPVVVPAPRPALDLQNLSYAFQWWLFAAFAVALWVRTVVNRHRDELADLDGRDGPDAPEGDAPVAGPWEDGPVSEEPPQQPDQPSDRPSDRPSDQRGVRA